MELERDKRGREKMERANREVQLRRRLNSLEMSEVCSPIVYSILLCCNIPISQSEWIGLEERKRRKDLREETCGISCSNLLVSLQRSITRSVSSCCRRLMQN